MNPPAALDPAWDEITLPSVPRGDFNPPPWVSSVEVGEPSSAGFASTGLLLAVLLAGLAGTFVGLFLLGA